MALAQCCTPIIERTYGVSGLAWNIPALIMRIRWELTNNPSGPLTLIMKERALHTL